MSHFATFFQKDKIWLKQSSEARFAGALFNK